MANIVVVVDQDPRRRAVYVETLKSTIAPFAGLTVEAVSGENCSIIWSAASNAPVNTVTDSEGAAIVLGEAIDELGNRQSAATVRRAWCESAATTWDGYYASIVVDTVGSVTAGADLLGLLPLYYWQGSGVIIVTTSPELIASHPAFSAKFNVEGLVRILLVNGLVGGVTLWEGVRRLQPGHHLCVRDGKLMEVEAYRIPEGLDAATLPLEGHVSLMGEALASAVKRHAPSGPRYGMLLSGGLDSRMVGGFLMHAGIQPRALTVGLAGDLEMRCAVAAAQALGIEQITAEPNAEQYPEYARLHAQWEHLANGFNTIRDWWTLGQVRPLGDRVATGLVADAMIGGTAINWAFSPSPPTMSFDAFWKNMPQMGISVDIVRDLLRPEYADLVQHVMKVVRAEYDGYGDLGSYRAWRFDIAHGERFHVGSTAWRLAFGAWPVLPMLDRKVIKVASSIPASSLALRVAQLELVKTYLPELGNVPLDRSDLLKHEAQFIAPRLRNLLEERIRKEFGRVRRRLSGRESRYWYRVNDFNSDAWRTVRRAAEPNRTALERVFNRKVLDEILPHPDELPTPHGRFVSESGRKLLLGLMQWTATHS